MVKSLNESGFLLGVGFPAKSQNQLLPGLRSTGIDENDSFAFTKKDWQTALVEILHEKQVDTVWVLTFPWKVPNSMLAIPSYGFINFHFGILPKYRGIDPIFWQFKNREKNGGLTVHVMNETIDDGPVLLQEFMPIMPGQTYGLHCQRLGQFAPSLVSKILDLQQDDEFEYLKLDAPSSFFDKKPSDEELTINWTTHTSEDIEWLVNGTNPKYQGARTTVSGIAVRILEVTPVNMENKIEAVPGHIVHADAIYGLIVACCDGEFIRITVVQMADGYFSGVKLFNLGFGLGQIFQ